MCHRIGAVVLAEGVESKNEILNCMSKNIDIFQGFYFARPKATIDLNLQNSLHDEVYQIGDDYKKKISANIEKKRVVFNDAEKLAEKVLEVYLNSYNTKEKLLKKIIDEHKNLEAIYKIDYHTGLQYHDTIINIDESILFKPTQNNDDHSLKEYYFIAKNSSHANYLSTKYVSKASGNMCRTYSSIVTVNDTKYILCLDIISK